MFIWAGTGQEIADLGGAWWGTQVCLEMEDTRKPGGTRNIRVIKTDRVRLGRRLRQEGSGRVWKTVAGGV